MSTPPPPFPSGPYGPPQQPHPYGQQSYGQPPLPYTQQQPYPAQAAWGQPPIGTQPQARRSGKPVWIGLSTAVAVLAGLFVLKHASQAANHASGAGFPEAKHKITVPGTLLNGQYKLDEDLSQTAGKQVIDGTYDPKTRNPQAVAARYTADSPRQPGVLVISGIYGQFKDPAASRKKMMAGAAKSESAKVTVPARDVTPPGSDTTLSCQVLTTRQGGAEATLPMCAWADENTAASIGVVTGEISQQAPDSVDLTRIAETALKVRAETRQPIG
ncbi:hypothetical protein ACYTFC_30135 [Streptomyces globosus]|uniref:hypothetical protein n=1 Tax=Streptomyces sp. WAC05292 TaxID=2487418 RepID=UPI000F73C307|nr:hypothetical protein [Streptomyces sp. WAC05292]RSS90415.1 hypothetical protein EF903_12490 [Streptomyces sp. WAC05292]